MLVAGLVALAACSGESGPTETSAPPPPATSAVTTTQPSVTSVAETIPSESTTTSTTVPIPDSAVMQLSFQFAADARWSDGTKISVADVACTVQAMRSTPGSTESEAYVSVIDVRAGRAEDVVEVYFDRVVAGYRAMFDRLFQASAVDDCSDVSVLWEDEPPSPIAPLKVEVWNSAQMILGVTEEAEELGFKRLVFVPIGDIDLEVDVLRSGEVDLIVPELSVGVAEGLDDPNLRFELQSSGRHEDLYLNDTSGGAFADPAFRDAFWRSVDRDRLIVDVYDLIRPGIEAWDCGPVTDPEWCDGVAPFAGSFDPGGAAQALTEAGWTFDADGHWQDASGEPHQIRWLVDGGHGRQAQLVESLVPLMSDSGFDLAVEECSGDCVFRDRLAAGDWDLVVYAEEGLADIGLFARRYSCSQRSSSDQPGWNVSGFCDAESDALLGRASSTRVAGEQSEYVRGVLGRLARTRHVLPLVRIPSAIAWRPDKLGPESVLTDIRAAALWDIDDLLALEDLDGDGQIVIGVEHWPSCENPLLVCGGVGWYRRNVGSVVVPGIWSTDDGRTLTHTSLVRQEPFVTLLRS
jgi:ABC-type transport system substrate-binding protein